MRTIWKYSLEVKAEQGIMMPDQAQILSVQYQGEKLVLWVLVNPKLKQRDRVIAIHGTGHRIEFIYSLISEYIGTVQRAGGAPVGHVFDLGYVQEDGK